MTGPLFSLRGISFTYPGGRRVFDAVDFELHPGDRVALCLLYTSDAADE